MSDSEKQIVYAAERQLGQMIAVGGPVRALGRTWELEPEQKFATPSSASLFTTLTCMELGLPPVKVRERRGELLSHYQASKREIALASWGWTRTTLCHELAHHLTQTRWHIGDHDVSFRMAMMEILAHTGAPVQAELLGELWRGAGLVCPRTAVA